MAKRTKHQAPVAMRAANHTTVTIDKRTHDRLKRIAGRDDRSIASVIRRMVAQHEQETTADVAAAAV